MQRNPSAVGERVRAVFAAAGCQGWCHARDLDADNEIGIGEDVPVAAASVFKVQVALELFRQVEEGALAAGQRIALDPRGRTPGPTGISLMRDRVEVSLRDLALLMLTVSDNAATDEILRAVGLDRVKELGRSLGLTATRVRGDTRWILDAIAADCGFPGWEELRAGEAVDPLRLRRALRPENTVSTSARDSTRLLSAIWADEGAPPPACAEVRRLMRLQLTRNRLATGYERSVVVAAKSGSLLGWVRNEVGVVEVPGGGRFAVAVFTVAEEHYRREAEINSAIGAAARMLVESLQGRRGA